MTDFRLYLAIGIPTFAVLIGIFIDVVHYRAINARFDSLDSRFDSLENRFDNLEARFERASRI